MRRIYCHVFRCLSLLLIPAWPMVAPDPGIGAEPGEQSTGTQMLESYFQRQTITLMEQTLAGVDSRAAWEGERAEAREQLEEMLGLSPMPERTPLQAETTGRIEREDFSVEMLHFQSMPGLYVTANLYLPADQGEPAPTILYVCGHARRTEDGVSYGNKTAYHHHGVWFARHGYVCLVIDTVQLGEIQGLHHGTYREGMWWWNARGYTSAGVEAWNGIRALDYLEGRPEVDADRIGVTGRSGGGAYSWWIAALDDRIRAAAPVAGITDLHNHILDDTVEGHCDCMFPVNTYRWDFTKVAALVAPRPLLIVNTDRDAIFPLEGVNRVHRGVRAIYELYDQRESLGLVITPGPHGDTQDLRVPVFRWFNRHLKDDESLIDRPAERVFDPSELRVLADIPEDERNTTIHEDFVPKAGPFEPPESQEAWGRRRDEWLEMLRRRCFRGWPEAAPAPALEEVFAVEAPDSEATLTTYELTSQQPFRLRLYLVSSGTSNGSDAITLRVLDETDWEGWSQAMLDRFGPELPMVAPELSRSGTDRRDSDTRGLRLDSGGSIAFLAPRGIGGTAWEGDDRAQTHIRRRFMLLGQTLDGMRVWDIRRGIAAVREMIGDGPSSLTLEASRQMAGNALYAALFEESVTGLELSELPPTHREGPIYLNVLRFLDMPQAVAMAAESMPVVLRETRPADWQYVREVRDSLNWPADRVETLGPKSRRP